MHIWYLRHCADTYASNKTIDCVYRSKYNISKTQCRFQNNRYAKLQSMQWEIIGCRIRDFEKMLLSNCQTKRIIRIDRWTCWAIRWHPAQCSRVGRFASNHIRVDSSGVIMTQTALVKRFSFNLDQDLKQQSGHLVNTTSIFTLDIFSDFPAGFQWIKYLLLILSYFQWLSWSCNTHSLTLTALINFYYINPAALSDIATIFQIFNWLNK